MLLRRGEPWRLLPFTSRRNWSARILVWWHYPILKYLNKEIIFFKNLGQCFVEEELRNSKLHSSPDRYLFLAAPSQPRNEIGQIELHEFHDDRHCWGRLADVEKSNNLELLTDYRFWDTVDSWIIDLILIDWCFKLLKIYLCTLQCFLLLDITTK